MSLNAAVPPPLSASLVALLLVLAPVLAGAAPKGVGIDLEGMDKSVAPGDDFFKHANGAWLRVTEIPPDRGSYGAGVIVSDRTDERVAQLIQEAGRRAPAAGSVAQKIADYHASYMDAEGIEAKGLAPLQPTLDRIGRRDRPQVPGPRAGQHAARRRGRVQQHELLHGQPAGRLGRPGPAGHVPLRAVPPAGGLDMPDRAYYVDESARMQKLRQQCQEHMAAILKLARVPEAEARAARVFELERRIAQAHVEREKSEALPTAPTAGRARSSRRARPGWTGPRTSRRRGLGSQKDFVVCIPPPSPASPGWWAASPSTPGRTT